MRSLRVIFVTTLAVFSIVGPVSAASSDNEIVVTATRTAQSVDATLAPVTVITREDIENSPASDLRELLLGSPGIDASANGGYGKTTGLFLRGTESDHVLTLVDGVKLFSATLGTTAFQFIPLDQIDRIEIVRGPRSSLWGSEAIGGVIHIFTRKGGDDTNYRLSAGIGSDSSAEASAGIAGRSGATRFGVQASAFDTDGIDVSATAQPDEDGYDNRSVSINLQREFGSGSEFEAGLLRAEGATEFDSPFDALSDVHEDDFVQQTAHLILRWLPSDIWSTSLQLAQSRDESETSLNGARSAVFDTTRDAVSWQNDLQVGDANLLSAGIDYSDDSVSGTTVFEQGSRDNVGVFAQWQGEVDRHRLLLGLRRDDNGQFGTQTTGNINYGLQLKSDLQLLASYGTAFKSPSFNDLFFPGFGNPNLNPEESDSIEIGLKGNAEWGGWAVRAFHTQIDNLIGFDPVTFLPFNVGKSEIDGLEFEVDKRYGPWNLSAAITVLDPQDADTGNRLPRRAERIASLRAQRRIGRLLATASLVSQ
ncbi:MAG: TonB-dependent receptor, partial [Gammaproteobacteria bacterium]|nr:TonB-dependent receptor [Gammaproteobacteria bacterium]